MISFSRVSKQYGRQVLFVDASFQLNPGEKVGLVGPKLAIDPLRETNASFRHRNGDDCQSVNAPPLGSINAKRSDCGVFCRTRPAIAMRSHSVLPLPVVPATNIWALTGFDRSMNLREPERSIPSGTRDELPARGNWPRTSENQTGLRSLRATSTTSLPT